MRVRYNGEGSQSPKAGKYISASRGDAFAESESRLNPLKRGNTFQPAYQWRDGVEPLCLNPLNTFQHILHLGNPRPSGLNPLKRGNTFQQRY